MRTELIMMAALLSACAGEETLSQDEQTELMRSAPDPEAAAFRARTEAAIGKEILLAPLDQGIALEGEANDRFNSSNEVGDDVEKTQTPIVWGWAMKGTNKLQAKGQNPKAHCDLFGLTCDGKVHSQLDDSYIDDGYDFLQENLGRCGRYDTGADYSWKPCIVPYGNKQPGGKLWRWRWDPSSCPNDAYGRSVIYWGLQQAFFGLDSLTDLDFIETTAPDEQITIKCDGSVPDGAMGMAVPMGTMRLRYAADHVFQETCEDGDEGIPPTNGDGNYSYHFADMYYTYNYGQIMINWNGWAGALNMCASTQAGHRNISRSAAMHELGHLFGFQHEAWTDTRGANYHTELMNTNPTCQQLLFENSQWHPLANQLVNDMDLPATDKPLTIYDEDISCLFPR